MSKRSIDSADKWIWLDGTEFSYKNWAPNEPSNHRGAEDTIVINWHGSGKWNDGTNDDLTHINGFICQYKAF